MHRISTGRERLARSTTIGRVTRALSVHHVGRNGENRLCGNRVAIELVPAQFLHERLDEPDANGVTAIVVVSERRVLPFDGEIDGQSTRVTNYSNASMFDRGQGIDRDGQTSNATCHGTDDIAIMKRHF